MQPYESLSEDAKAKKQRGCSARFAEQPLCVWGFYLSEKFPISRLLLSLNPMD
ncbi:hypothetical protein PGTDC60_1390 [Porphyromonas gingivalis TDC60]|nr:hypothetical protein PGTDC60_1390 [Porphyromonas gingivalis TDC60]